ncbi:MAG: hypothetical protein DRI26_01095 [Chloroflexi bacterium]|nr:MAG: hypothetical protein DRI26_01095 [Chloroflexota bacterium]
MAKLFQKVVDGPSSYSPGGFAVQVGEFEKIESGVQVMMDPTTKLGTSAIPGFHTAVDANTPNVVRVQVFQAWWSDPSRAWEEVASGTDLSAASFILTGRAY